MPIDFTCPHCGSRTLVDDQYAGQTGPCAQCGQTITVPLAAGAGLGRAAAGSSVAVPLIIILAGVALVGLCLAGGLAVMLFPAVGSARAAARRSQDMNNLKMIGLALHNYHDVYNSLPPGSLRVGDLPPEQGHSWLARILPYVEQQPLHSKIDYGEPWDSPVNSAAAAVPVPTFLSVSHPDHQAHLLGAATGYTHFVGIAGLGADAPGLPLADQRAGVFGYDRMVRIADITDGTANTMMVAETQLNNGPWAAGGPSTIRGLDQSQQPYLGQGRQFGREGGCTVLFVDGSVRFLDESIDPRVLEALSTIRGGEVVPANF